MPGNLNDCICALVDLLGGTKTQVVTLITGLIQTLEALQATLSLFSVNFVDEARKAQYEAKLTLIEATVATIETPFNAILGYTSALSDCDSVNSFSRTLKSVRDFLLSDVEDKRYEVQQYIAALEDKDNEIEAINKRIQMLTQIRDALDQCGNG